MNIQLYMNIISIILVVTIIYFCITLLYNKNKKIKEEIKTIKEEKNRFKKEIKKINPDEKNLQKFNKIIRDFLKEEHNINYNIPYLELAKKFDKEKKPKLVELCKLISKISYSKDKINKSEIEKLKDLALKIIK